MWRTAVRTTAAATRTRRALHARACIRADDGARSKADATVPSATPPAAPTPAAAAASPAAVSSPVSSDFLTGISALINASRTSTTKGLWQMRAQERKEMTSQLHLPINAMHSRGTPITPPSAIAAHAQAQDPSRPEAAADAASAPTPSSRAPKPSNPFPAILPFDSFWSVSLPFDSELSLYDDYVRFDGGVRFERILEDLDAFAGNVAHLHVKQGTQKLMEQHARKLKERESTDSNAELDSPPPPPVLPDMQIVTASVDGIVMNPRRRFPMDKFLAMQGCVTWVGSSSMEIWIEMRVVPDPAAWGRMSLQEKLATAGKDSAEDGDSIILNAYFLMVARDTRTQKSTFVPPLDVARMSKEDRARFERGEASAVRRKREAATSLQRIPPTPAEIGLIHALLMSDDSGASGCPSGTSNLEIAPAGTPFQPGAVVLRPKSVPMRDTEMSSAAMTQPQDRNTNGKIFGGWLMSRAYELARCNAYMFCGANSAPYFIAVDHITFLRPVEIGSIISFRSKVTFAAGHPDTNFQLQVETLVHDLVGGKIFPSNVFHFTFQSPRVPVRRVVPAAYREAVDYLDGKRRREKLANTLRIMEQEHDRRGGEAAAEGTPLTKEAGPSLSDAAVTAAADAVPRRSTV